MTPVASDTSAQQLDLAERHVGVVVGLALRHDLEEAAAGVDHRLGETDELVGRGEGAGH